MSNTSLVWLVIVIIIIALGGWYFLYANNPQSPAYPSEATQTNQNPGSPDYSPNGTPGGSSSGTGANINVNVSGGSQAPMSASVTLGANGFTSNAVTIKVGGTVTWQNQGGGQMWVASGVHPVHSAYDGTTRDQHCAAGYTGSAPFDECGAGNSYSFTFNKAGTWPYHNHLNASQTGTVTVVQ